MDLSIIIVNYNSGNRLKDVVDSIVTYTKGVMYEIIIVDNDSTDNSLDDLAGFQSKIMLIQNHSNLGYARANNIALQRANGDAIVLLNPDIRFDNNVFRPMYDYLKKDRKVGIVGCKIMFPNGDVQTSAYSYTTLKKRMLQAVVRPIFKITPWSGRIFVKAGGRLPGNIAKTYLATHGSDKTVDVDCVSGACMMFMKSVIERVGYLDENFFMYFEDEDFCRRVHAAEWRVVYYPDIFVIHELGWDKNKADVALRTKRYESLRYYCMKYYRTHYIYCKIFNAYNYIEHKLFGVFS